MAGRKKRYNRHIHKTWANRKAVAIKPREIDDVHKKVGQRAPYEANRLRALLHHMFSLAGLPQWGFVPVGHPNPVNGIEKFPERKRKRYATPDDVKALATQIDKEQYIYVRAALWLYLLTGMRKSELLEARRNQINWKRAQFKLPDNKAGEEQVVVLNAAALAVLKAIPELEGNPCLLPGLRKGKHLVNISKPWRAIRKAAGCEDLRLHDLRRSVGSWLSQSGVELNTIREALPHADISTTLVYARRGFQCLGRSHH